MQNGKHHASKDDAEYFVKISRRFVIMSLLACSLLAYAVGRTARVLLIDGPQQRLLASLETPLTAGGDRVMKLPNPVLKDKPIPRTTYTSMNFDTARSSSINSRWVVVEGQQHQQAGEEKCAEDTCDASSSSESCSSCSRGKEPDAFSAALTTEEEDGDGEIHLPAGQHLLMDIRNVDSSFLASEERLATAMLDVVGDCGLTLLSYHCHGLQPSGVSCVGVLLESHVSFHTWPSEGVITLDLFTCGSNSLLPIVDAMERLFGIPANSEGPQTVWAYKVRGFGEETEEELEDLFTFPIGTMTEYKKEVVSITKQTSNIKNDRIDVYDVLRPVYQSYESYKRSMKDDGSYESQFKEIFRPDRIVFVNGVLQSRRSAEIPYHEALVHPGMFAHENPKRVLLLNCGGGAALREVLKHKTVEKVVMVDEEEEIVKISKQFFPEYDDCNYISGLKHRRCFDDPRVKLVYSDMFDWAAKVLGQDNAEKDFDVIIMDDLFYVAGPKEYGDFVLLLSKMMSTNGVFVAQMGEAPALDWPAIEHSFFKNRGDFVKSLADNGFKHIVEYEESHLGFWRPWQFLTAFGNYETSRENWYRTIGWFDLSILQRTWPTTSGDSSLFHFDGAVMQSYSHPGKASELVFCRGHPDSKYCKDGRDLDRAQLSLPAPEQVLRNSFRAGEEYNPAADRSSINSIHSAVLHRIEKDEVLTIFYRASGADVVSLQSGEASVVFYGQNQTKVNSL